MRDACQVDFENNNAVGPYDESSPCAEAIAGALSAPSLSSPNVYTVASAKSGRILGSRIPPTRASCEGSLSSQCTARLLLSRPGPGRTRSSGAWGGTPRALTTLLQPHLATVAGGAGDGDEDEVNDFVVDALAANECGLRAGD